MAPRATWKGFLKLGELSCAVSLHAAVSANERISFRTVDSTTGHAVRRRFVDEETGEVVEKEDQVKGYDTGSSAPILIDPDEVAALHPESDKTLAVEGFLPCAQVDPLYFDRPYFLAPADAAAAPAYALIRDGLRAKKVAALAYATLFRRVRTLVLRPDGDGLIATTLHFDYEVRAEQEAFSGLKTFKVEGEMLDLATHIIATKRGHVDLQAFEDRYEAALAELVRAKIEGKPLPRPKAAPRSNVVNLLDALRQSAGAPGTDSADGTARKPGAGKGARARAPKVSGSKSTSAKSTSKKPASGASAGAKATTKSASSKAASRSSRAAPRRKAS